MKRKINIMLALLVAFYLISPAVLPISYLYAKNTNQTNSKSIPKDNPAKTQAGQSKKSDIPANSSTYDFRVNFLSIRSAYGTNQQIDQDITIQNTADFKWSKQEVRLGYHWIDENSQYEVFRGDNTDLTKDVAPDQSLSQKIKIRTPEIPGKFKLSIDVIKGNTWFTTKTDYRFEKEVTISGNLDIKSYESQMSINDGAEFANNPQLKVEVTAYGNQPGSVNAGFIYDYVQFTESPVENILNGTAHWSNWTLLSEPWSKSNVNFTLKNQSVGVKKMFMRYRAIKKQSEAVPSSYGEAIYHYGRSSKTSGVYYVDEIFFDNVPPVGGIEINGGSSSTTSRYGDLHIWASDEVNGVMGSGLNGMRLASDCDPSSIGSNSWGEWETDVTGKSNYYLGSGTTMTVCVQVRDKAGNVATFNDNISFIQITNGSGSGGGLSVGIGYGIGTPDNKFANKTSADLRKPRIEFDRFIDIFGSNKWNNVKSWDMPEPLITFVNRVDQTTVEVSGVAIRKWNPVDVMVNNEFRYCFFCGSGWEWFYSERSIEHVKVQILKEDGTVLKEFWNDDSQGRWQVNLALGTNLSETDKIHAKVYTYGKHYFDGLKWWKDTYENNIEFVAWNLWSGDSQKMNIPLYNELLIAQLQANFGLKAVNGSDTWKSSELEFIMTILSELPRTYYDHPYIKELRREGDGGRTFGSYSPSTHQMKFYNGMFSGSSTHFTEYGWVDGNMYAKLVFVHEMAHAWEEVDKARGAPVLSKFADISWIRDTVVYEEWQMDPTAKITTVDYDKHEIIYNDFVNDYAIKYSYEDWAESVAVYKYLSEIFNKGTPLLKSKGAYSAKPFVQ